VPIEKWMTSRLVTIQEDEPASHAFELMLTNDIRHLPVLTRTKKLVGIITDRDLSEAVIPATPSDTPRSMYHTVKNIKAKQIMTPNPVTIGTDATIQEAAQIFLERKIDCLPVKDHKARLIGIVTSTDILKAFVEFTRVLGDTRRIDIAMDGNDYQKVIQVLESHGVVIVSVGITEDEKTRKTVVSFRIRNTDVKKLGRALRKQGLLVLSGD
jgi:acetoin utilization protein AcuB